MLYDETIMLILIFEHYKSKRIGYDGTASFLRADSSLPYSFDRTRDNNSCRRVRISTGQQAALLM